MCKILMFAVFLTLQPCVLSAVDFYEALASVESGGNPSAVGDGGRSVGLYQISKIYVDDVNRIAGTRYTHDDRFDPVKSRKMVGIYLAHYGRRYTRMTGHPTTLDVLAAIHNGGPDGWRKHSTLKYRQKVRMAMCAYAKKRMENKDEGKIHAGTVADSPQIVLLGRKFRRYAGRSNAFAGTAAIFPVWPNARRI